MLGPGLVVARRARRLVARARGAAARRARVPGRTGRCGWTCSSCRSSAPRARGWRSTSSADGTRRQRWEFTGTSLHEHARTLWLDGPRRDIRLRLILDGRLSPERAGELADPRPIGLQLLRIGVAGADAA